MNKIWEDFMVRFDWSVSLQWRTSKDDIIITRALCRSGYRILVEFKLIYLVDSKCYLCLNIISDEFQTFSVCLHIFVYRLLSWRNSHPKINMRDFLWQIAMQIFIPSQGILKFFQSTNLWSDSEEFSLIPPVEWIHYINS